MHTYTQGQCNGHILSIIYVSVRAALLVVSGRLGTLAYWVHGVNTTEPISASLYAGTDTEVGLTAACIQ